MTIVYLAIACGLIAVTGWPGAPVTSPASDIGGFRNPPCRLAGPSSRDSVRDPLRPAWPAAGRHRRAACGPCRKLAQRYLP